MIAIVVMLPFSLYIPFVQNAVKGIVARNITQATGYEVEIGEFHLSFPIDAEIDGLRIEDKGKMLIYARQITADIKLLPLLKLNVVAPELSIHEVSYRMLSQDSSLYIDSKINSCQIINTSADISKNVVAVGKGSISGGNIHLAYDSGKVQETPQDTTKAAPWRIMLGDIALTSIEYRMEMPGAIDSLYTNLQDSRIESCTIDLQESLVDCNSLTLNGISVKYFFPKESATDSKPVETMADNSSSAPWTIKGNKITLSNGNALYALSGSAPCDGLDFNHIIADDITIGIDSFYNRGRQITVPVKEFRGKERSGLEIKSCNGLFYMDSLSVRASSFRIATALSEININANASSEALGMQPEGKFGINVKSSLNVNEMAKAVPAIRAFVHNIPSVENSDISFKAEGKINNIVVESHFDMPRYATLNLTGKLANITEKYRRHGNINLTGNLANINFIKPTLLDVKMQKQVDFPPMKITGKFNFAGENGNGNLDITSGNGNMAFGGEVKMRGEQYSASVVADDFPLGSILPLSSLGNLSATLNVDGKGFNPIKPDNYASAKLNISGIGFQGKNYNNITADINVIDGLINAVLSSKNSALDFFAGFDASISGDVFDYSLKADITNIDLQALDFSETTLNTHMNISSSGSINPNAKSYDMRADIRNLNVNIFDYTIATNLIQGDIFSDSDTTLLNIANRDFNARVKADCYLDTLLQRLSLTSDEVMHQIDRRYLTFSRIDSLLPHFNIKSRIGNDNIISEYLARNGIEFKSITIDADNDSVFAINGMVDRFSLPALRLDTITINIREKREAILYGMHIGNKNGNLDQMAKTDIHGYLSDNYFNLLFDQRNRAGKTGFYFGINGELTDSVFSASIFPEYPIIGFNEWELNSNNYFEYNYFTKKLYSDIWLNRQNSLISLTSSADSDEDEQENIDLNIQNIDIRQWTRFSPFAPDISGELSAKARISYDDKNYWGNANFNIASLIYNGTKIGDVGFATTLEVNPLTSFTDAFASLSVDGNEAVSASGVLNDSTINDPFKFNLNVKRLPLKLIDAFVPDKFIQSSGFLVGDISMKGSSKKPVFNGTLTCDSAFIRIPSYSCRLNFSNDTIRMDSSIIRFDDFDLYGTNSNMICIDGIIDINNLNNPYSDIHIKGTDVEIINSKNKSGTDMFGKGYINIDATAIGRLSQLKVNADVSVLGNTNITYVLQDNIENTIKNDDSMVKFVQFSDTAKVVKQEVVEEVFSMNVAAGINIEPGATFNVYLSPNGHNRAQIMGNGSLAYTLNSQGDAHLSGRFNVDQGYVKYTPPLIGEKNFEIDHGSYIIWGGEMLNPMLHVSARSKQTNTVVSEGENAQQVKFIITASINNTLNDMDLKFDLIAENNMTVQSELLSMSQEQRANQAINLMLYNNYTGSLSSSVTSSNVNMLYSFLSSQLNSWAANVVKGVDISLGINEYKNSMSSSGVSMNYSYKISKSLFNDRFKMSVGGNYDTSASGDNAIAQNLLNDISFEYMITPSGTMSVEIYNRLNRNNIYSENINETGAAFVLRRKLLNLSELFKRSTWFGKSKNDTTTHHHEH